MRCPDQAGPKKLWHDWFSRSFLLRLDDNYNQFTSCICTRTSLEQGIITHSREQITSDVQQALRTHCQQAAYQHLLNYGAPSSEFRVRENLERWKLHDRSRHPGVTLSGKQDTPNWTSNKCLDNMRALRRLVPPRVHSAVFSTVWNRWTTHRRMQKRALASTICLLKCSETAEDSVEHYANCPRVREVGAHFLNLDPSRSVNLHTFVCCNPHIKDEDELTATALLIYAVYRATNYVRYERPIPTDATYHAITQWVREGARGHNNAMSVLSSRWKDRKLRL